MGKSPSIRIDNDLKALRAQRNLTQQELATEVGVTRVTINYIENGEYRPSLELSFLLARFFGKRIEEVFHFEAQGGQREKHRA